jgi:hypothetical protein
MARLSQSHAASWPVAARIVGVVKLSRKPSLLRPLAIEDAHLVPAAAASVSAVVWVLATLMLWLGATDYGFAQVPPSDIDLKAAYCIETNRAILAEQSGQDPKPLALAQMTSDAHDHINRLQSYLLPRLPDLDALPLLAASKRADLDIAQLKSLANSCQQRAITECGVAGGAKCLVDSYHTCTRGELLDRVQSCTSLDWLPF